MLVLLGFTIATVVNTFAMEAAVLFTPAFLYVFPILVPGFPGLSANAAIGLALFVELFGYSSSVAAYWYRHQIDFNIAKKILVLSVPAAIFARSISYFIPSKLLMVGFGLLLTVLAVILYEAHEHGPSLMKIFQKRPEFNMPEGLEEKVGSGMRAVDNLAERPEASLLSVLHEDYEAQTRLTEDVSDAEENPPSSSMGGAADREEDRANGKAVIGDESDKQSFHLELPDAVISVLGGTLAGLVGIAIGELTQALLTLRKRVPLKLSTGTSALILHLTVVSALVTNILLLRFAPGLTGEGFSVPFNIGIFVATGCFFGGQAGAYLNNKLSEEKIMAMLISVYFLVGIFVTVKTLFLGAGAH